MIYEQRTYQVHAGKAAEFLKIYEANGVGIITRYARLIGAMVRRSTSSCHCPGSPKSKGRAAASSVCSRPSN